MPVVDASVVVAYLVADPGAGVAARHLHAGGAWAPHLIDAEVGQALRGQVRGGHIRPFDAASSLDDLARLPLQRAGHLPLLARAHELRDNLTFYDALYVALAEELEMPLVTFDPRMSQAPGLRTQVHVIA